MRKYFYNQPLLSLAPITPEAWFRIAQHSIHMYINLYLNIHKGINMYIYNEIIKAGQFFFKEKTLSLE